MIRRAVVILASVVLSLGSGRALGADYTPLAFRLSLEAPAGCLDREAFVAYLQARSPRLREDASNWGAPLVRVELHPTEGEVMGSLAIREGGGAEGDRELRGADCQSVANGLAFVAAVVLDPSAAVPPRASELPRNSSIGPAPSAPGATAAPSIAAQPESVSLSPSTATRPESVSAFQSRSHSLRWSLGWALAAASGLGPDPQIVPRAFVDVGLPAPLDRTSARLSVGRGFTHTVETSNGTADITLTDLRLEPCFDAWSSPSFRGRACMILDVDVLAGEGRNTLEARNETRAAFEVGLGARPTFVLHDSIFIGLLLGVAVPITQRYRFYFASPDRTAYELAAWSALGELNVGVRFW